MPWPALIPELGLRRGLVGSAKGSVASGSEVDVTVVMAMLLSSRGSLAERDVSPASVDCCLWRARRAASWRRAREGGMLRGAGGGGMRGESVEVVLFIWKWW